MILKEIHSSLCKKGLSEHNLEYFLERDIRTIIDLDSQPAKLTVEDIIRAKIPLNGINSFTLTNVEHGNVFITNLIIVFRLKFYSGPSFCKFVAWKPKKVVSKLFKVVSEKINHF